MKDLLKFAFRAVFVVGGLFILYYFLKAVGEGLRGFEAVGGEILIFTLPVIVWVIVRNIKDGADGK